MESGPRGPKAHVGQNHVGGERNSRESQKLRQNNQGPLTSLTPAFLLTSWGLLCLTASVCVWPPGPLWLLSRSRRLSVFFLRVAKKEEALCKAEAL